MKWIVIIVFSFLALVLNFAIVDDLIMPDPCYYHSKEMNIFLQLFYSSSSASGGHPEINLFNLICTALIGGILGNIIYNFCTKTATNSR